MDKTNNLTEIERLTHCHNKERVGRLFDGPWITLYDSFETQQSRGGHYCALLKKNFVPKALLNCGWDLLIGDGSPGYCLSKGRVSYSRFFSSVEPLVYIRDFASVKPRIIELSEEFRHFHNLYADHKNERYIKIDENGDDQLIAEVSTNLVDRI
jgi:hypothetical protein